MAGRGEGAGDSHNWTVAGRDEAGDSHNGWIDDVRVYDYALTQAEIKALYANGGQGIAQK